jgi:hypothetical protein
MRLRAACLLGLGLAACSDDEDLQGVEPVRSPPLAPADAHADAPVDAAVDAPADAGIAFTPGATVAAGAGTRCWREGSDAVWCANWQGDVEREVLRAPSPIVDLAVLDERARSIDYKAPLACAATASGSLYCWTEVTPAALVPTPGRVVRVSLGNRYGCVLLDGGEVWCAINEVSGLGRVDLPGPARSVAVGAAAACAALVGGEVYCWGERVQFHDPRPNRPDSGVGLPAHGPEPSAPTPVRLEVPPSHAVVLGRYNRADAFLGCALHEGDRATCWGAGYDHLDFTAPGYTTLPELLAGGVRQIAVGNDLNLFLHLTVWVLGPDGTARYPGMTSLLYPVTDVAEVAAGSNAFCVRKHDGTTEGCRRPN